MEAMGKSKPGQNLVLGVERCCDKPDRVAFCAFGLFGEGCGVFGNLGLKKSTSVQNLMSHSCASFDDRCVERSVDHGGLACQLSESNEDGLGHSCDILESEFMVGSQLECKRML